MCSIMHHLIYYFVDSFYIRNRYVMVIYYVTLFVYLLFNYLSHHIFAYEACMLLPPFGFTGRPTEMQIPRQGLILTARDFLAMYPCAVIACNASVSPPSTLACRCTRPELVLFSPTTQSASTRRMHWPTLKSEN